MNIISVVKSIVVENLDSLIFNLEEKIKLKRVYTYLINTSLSNNIFMHIQIGKSNLFYKILDTVENCELGYELCEPTNKDIENIVKNILDMMLNISYFILSNMEYIRNNYNKISIKSSRIFRRSDIFKEFKDVDIKLSSCSLLAIYLYREGPKTFPEIDVYLILEQRNSLAIFGITENGYIYAIKEKKKKSTRGTFLYT